MGSKYKGRLLKILGGHKMNKEFREFLENELYKVKKLNEGMLTDYGAGVYNAYAYILKKYDEFHKPVIVPDFVAEWIKESKEKGYPLAYAINCSKGELGKWLHGCGTDTETEENQELFAKAWLEGYTVEEEQRYYVINNQNYFLLAKDKGHGFVFSTGGNSKLGNTDNISATFKLTEQEIKDYDERYMAFAIPVENDK